MRQTVLYGLGETRRERDCIQCATQSGVPDHHLASPPSQHVQEDERLSGEMVREVVRTNGAVEMECLSGRRWTR